MANASHDNYRRIHTLSNAVLCIQRVSEMLPDAKVFTKEELTILSSELSQAAQLFGKFISEHKEPNQRTKATK